MLLLLLFTLAALSPLALARDPDLSTDELAFVTWNRKGQSDIWFSTTNTNTSDPWTSTARPHTSVSVWIVGYNLTYSLVDIQGNFSANGTTIAALTAFQINISANQTLVWPILTINRTNISANGTTNITEDVVNFGQMVVGLEAVAIVTETLPESILAEEAAKTLWWSVLWTVVLMSLTLLLCYLLVSSLKRGRVTSD